MFHTITKGKKKSKTHIRRVGNLSMISKCFCFYSIPFTGLFPPNETQFPPTETQFPPTEIQFPLTEIQFPLTEIHFPLTENQFPLTEI